MCRVKILETKQPFWLETMLPFFTQCYGFHNAFTDLALFLLRSIFFVHFLRICITLRRIRLPRCKILFSY